VLHEIYKLVHIMYSSAMDMMIGAAQASVRENDGGRYEVLPQGKLPRVRRSYAYTYLLILQ
jgi:hypothetical protein